MLEIWLRRLFTVLTVAVAFEFAATNALAFEPDDKDKPSYPTFGRIKRVDQRILMIVPNSAVSEKLADGFDWSEGPVWMKSEKALLFSDVPMNTVFQWEEGKKPVVKLKPSGYTGTEELKGEPGSNGLNVDSTGRLILCQHGDRRVARLADDGKSFVTLADKYDGKRFNSPNDSVFMKNGDLYFTDPPYGLPLKNDDPKKELPFNGVYRLAKDGTVTLLTKEMTYPNGIALSPDEKTLYVANSDPKLAIWKAFPVKPDGTLGEGKVFFDATNLVGPANKGLPDGMKVDSSGNIFATGPGGVFIFSSEGKHLGTIETDEATANCGWGDDGSTLYITADMYLARVRLKTKGLGF